MVLKKHAFLKKNIPIKNKAMLRMSDLEITHLKAVLAPLQTLKPKWNLNHVN